MADPRVEQKFSVDVSQPATPWKSDTVLDTPVHISPADGDTVCPDQPSAGSRIILEWGAVAGASFYILQWCNNSSFQGPTLRSIKQAGATYELPLGSSGIRMDEAIYWRVMAFDGASGISQKSDPWFVKYECEDQQASGQGDNKSGGPPGVGGDRSKCSDFDIHMQIVGQKTVMCCDRGTWKLQLVYNCKDANGRDLITFNEVVWSIIQNPADANNTIEKQNDKSVQVLVDCNKPQIFTLKATAEFTDLVEAGDFTCEAIYKVFVDCDTGLPQYKPWSNIRAVYPLPGINFYIHPEFRGDTIAPTEEMRSKESAQSGTVMFPPQLGGGSDTESAEPAGTVPIIHMTAMGPVVRTDAELFPEYRETKEKCETQLRFGSPVGEICEAQTHLAFGCGLKIHENRIEVDNTHLAGLTPNRKGLAAYGHCSLQVAYGCGLIIEDEKVAVDMVPVGSPVTTIHGFVPGSLAVEIEECIVTVFLNTIEYTLQQNDCGVLIGPVIEGSSTLRSAFAAIPTKTTVFDVYNCDMECVPISITELDCDF